MILIWASQPKEVKGHEQAYDRPCVVIKAFISLGLIVVVPCTTTFPKYSSYTNDSGNLR
ncbi:MAG: hypothetical protein DRJ05_00605 [Bacteroidetes bacterium]|nr:MAG: hypothetical protein DRJ05_00605 [Bacteroidota bacterium]